MIRSDRFDDLGSAGTKRFATTDSGYVFLFEPIKSKATLLYRSAPVCTDTIPAAWVFISAQQDIISWISAENVTNNGAMRGGGAWGQASYRNIDPSTVKHLSYDKNVSTILSVRTSRIISIVSALSNLCPMTSFDVFFLSCTITLIKLTNKRRLF